MFIFIFPSFSMGCPCNNSSIDVQSAGSTARASLSKWIWSSMSTLGSFPWISVNTFFHILVCNFYSNIIIFLPSSEIRWQIPFGIGDYSSWRWLLRRWRMGSSGIGLFACGFIRVRHVWQSLPYRGRRRIDWTLISLVSACFLSLSF